MRLRCQNILRQNDSPTYSDLLITYLYFECFIGCMSTRTWSSHFGTKASAIKAIKWFYNCH